MRKIFISVLALYSELILAGGYVTDSIYSCRSGQTEIKLSIGGTSKIHLEGYSIGICEGSAYVSGGDRYNCYGASKISTSMTCKQQLISLSWVGCFAPKKSFILKAMDRIGRQNEFMCDLQKKGGSFNMDGTHH